MNDENGTIKYSYKLKTGANQSCFAYGIKKAHSFFIHPDIIENALITLQKIDDIFSSITSIEDLKIFIESTEKVHMLLKEVLDRKIALLKSLQILKLNNKQDEYKELAKEQINKFRFELLAFLEENYFKF